jgi:gas vesicle protein
MLFTTLTLSLYLKKAWHFLQVVYTWIKGNWLLLLLLLGFIYAVFFARQKENSYNNLLKAFQDQMAQNQKELDDLRKIQEDQIKAQQEIETKYREVLDKIEKDYQDKLQQLDKEKEQEIKDIIAKNRDNPDAMAKELNTLLGIPLYPTSSQPT